MLTLKNRKRGKESNKQTHTQAMLRDSNTQMILVDIIFRRRVSRTLTERVLFPGSFGAI